MTAPLISREAIDEGHVQHNDVFGIWALEHRGRLLDAARMAHDLLDVAQAGDKARGVLSDDDPLQKSFARQVLGNALATFRARWPGVLEG